jgi:GNAT superfamily N-acetyltransferase
MKSNVEIISVNDSNLERVGFFCYKSKRKTEGYAKKLSWVRKRLAEGLGLLILLEDGVSKGFIEYISGQHAWRAVNAAGFLFIHCMWVVGKAKGKGYGSRLLAKCLHDAEEGGYDGVAVLTSKETWLTDDSLYLKFGFEIVETTPPAFSLLAKRFNPDVAPSLPKDWSKRLKKFGTDLTVIYTDQCPYIDRMKGAVHNVANSLGVLAHEVKLTNSSEVQARSPSPYGVYNVVYNGELIASHPIGTDNLLKLMQDRV